jgi:hypothetical protein
MTQQQIDKRVMWLQYLNTGLLTIILGISSMAAVILTNVKNTQSDSKVELARLKANQDYNSNILSNHEIRINELELFNATQLKEWVDANYIRKPQR